MKAITSVVSARRLPIPRQRRFDRRAAAITVALAIVAGALYLGWDWLAAAGLTSLIIGLLPCAAMCGLGLCASRYMGQGNGAGCHPTTSDNAPTLPTTASNPLKV